jgi:p70 ribosomal S6 kinase
LLPFSSLTSSFCTSSPYIAPEIFNNFGHSFEADFFALGALLFEMVSGEPPFTGVGKEERNSLSIENCGKWPEGISSHLKNLLIGSLNIFYNFVDKMISLILFE